VRADAKRNREALLAAARDVFAERGMDAPLDEIAKRAGIGNATMYRHFPTRQDLIVAVYADEVATLCGLGPELLAEHEPGEALFRWLREFVAHVATKRKLALSVTEHRSALFGEWHAAMTATGQELLTEAVRAGAVRDDVTVVDLLTLTMGIAAHGTAEQHEHLLALIRHGIEAGRHG
jgi:AcrR family transcriptional regulator